MIENIIKELESKNNIVILGFGIEGKSTYKLIRKYLKDKKITIADGNEKILQQNEYLSEDKNVVLKLGNGYLDDLDSYDCIIKSPGVNFKYVDYKKFKDKITSQIELFLKYSVCKTIGITGTKGKSTTSSLIYHVLQQLNIPSVFVGNIGIPVFDKIDEMSSDKIVVIELSCHQLQFVKHSPNISVLLNIYEEHLDLYKSYEDYVLAKLNIFKYQTENDYSIWGIDSEESYSRFNLTNNTYTVSFNKEKKISKNGVYLAEDGLYLNGDLVYSLGEKRKLLGKHNLYNIGVVLCISNILKLPVNEVVKAINDFKPLEHRLEYVGKFNEIDFYNDSISTIPETTINCIKSIPNLDTLILGGMNRNVDLSYLINYINNKECLVNNFILLPDTGHIIKDEITRGKVYVVNNMKDAVDVAYKATEKKKACALSPAAASYNCYKNFEERGNDYKNLVTTYKN